MKQQGRDWSVLLALTAPLIAPIAVADVHHVTTGAVLQSTFNGGAQHTVITTHIDATGLSPVNCANVGNYIAWMFPILCINETSHKSTDVVTLKGDCGEKCTDTACMSVALPALWPCQCVVHVDQQWLQARASSIWVHGLHVLLGPRATSANVDSGVMYLLASRVWCTELGIQGDGGRGRLVHTYDRSGSLLLEDVFLADMKLFDLGVAVQILSGRAALNNVTVRRVISTGNHGIGAITAWQHAHLLCNRCDVDAASAPSLSVAHSGVVYAPKDEQRKVWDIKAGVYKTVSEPPSTVVFLSINDKDIMSPPPAPAPAPLPSTPPPDVPAQAPPPVETPEPLPPTRPPVNDAMKVVGPAVAALLAAGLLGFVGFVLIRKYVCNKPTPYPYPLGPDVRVPILSNKTHKHDLFLSHDWGENQENHLQVSRVNRCLKDLGINTWFDEEQINFSIKHQMAKGIEDSEGVLLFVTKRYHDKVISDRGGDNCKVEFDIAMDYKPDTTIAVVMDEAMLDTGTWQKGMKIMGSKLYVSFVGIEGWTEHELQTRLKQLLFPRLRWLKVNNGE